jgi:four helix bundle protein
MIYNLCAKLPSDEKYGLVSQFKRASVSIALNIAEGAARQTDKEFYQFLTFSSGSLSENQTLTHVVFLNHLIT